MKKITKKLFSLLMVFAITLSNFLPFMPMIEVHASTIVDEIRITSSTTSVDPGVLPEFTVNTTTEAVNDIDTGNTGWSWWGQNSNAWSGFGAETPTAVNDGKTHYALDICVDLKPGYSFDENTKIYFNGVDVTSLGHSNINIMSWGGYVRIDLGTAGAELPKYTITYDANGGTGTIDSKTVYQGESVNLGGNTFTAPAGMSFDTWRIGNTNYEEHQNYTPTGDTVVKAIWTDKYIRESRATMTPSTISSDISANDLVFTSVDPSKYSVALWRVFDITDTNLNTDNGKYPNDAKFVAGHQYAIEFTFTAEGDYYEYDEITSGRTSTFYLNNQETDISAAVAISGSTSRRIVPTATNGSTPATYTVTFNSNGGSAVASQENIASGNTANEPTAPTKDGFTFNGWYQNAELTIPFTFDTPITANITLFAKWTENTPQTYTVTFKDGNNTLDSRNITSGNTVTRPNPDPIKSGFTFENWYANAEYTVVFDFSTPITGNTDIYARFVENAPQSYTLTYDVNGGNIIEPVTRYAGTKINLPTPTRNDYKFKEWQIWDGENNPVGAYLAGDEFEFTENTTLHAEWISLIGDINFNITFEDTTGEVLINEKRVMDEGSSYTGTKQNAGYIDNSMKNTIKITTSFGSYKASGVTINGTDYNFDNESDDHEIEVNGNTSYTIVVHGNTNSQQDRTIIWANADVNKNAQNYDEDMVLEHGSAKIVAIYDENDNKIHDEVEANADGMAWVPVTPGSKVVFEFVPEYGYQLTSVKANGFALEAQETTNQYVYTMPNTNVHFQAIFKQTSDVVDASSSKVKSGTIALGEGLDGGSARLTVNDITLSSDKIAGFENAAGDYTISNYLDIDLYNIFYKGKDDSNDVWSNKISELNKEATITIKLEEGIDANDIVLVHNIHDGEQFEIIEIDSYDKETNTITFKTKSFSNYAIATKNSSNNNNNANSNNNATNNTNTNTNTNTNGNPQTFDGISMWFSLFIVSLIGLAIGTFKFKKMTSK